MNSNNTNKMLNPSQTYRFDCCISMTMQITTSIFANRNLHAVLFVG